MYGCHLLQGQTFPHTYCDPSQFEIWRTTALTQLPKLHSLIGGDIFERGPPEEILTDNDAIFCSSQIKQFLDEWGVRLRLRCTYMPSGNGYSREIPPECEDVKQRTDTMWRQMTTFQTQLHQPTLSTHTESEKELTSHSNPAMKRYTDHTTLELKPPNSQCTTSFRKGRFTT